MARCQNPAEDHTYGHNVDVMPLQPPAALMKLLCQLAQAHCSGSCLLMLQQAGLHMGACILLRLHLILFEM